MSTENAPERKTRRSTSIPFLIIVAILGLVAYFKGEEIMTYTLYLQEKWIHDSKVHNDRRYDELLGPPKEGEYDWVAPDAPERKEHEPTATESHAEDGGSEPNAASDSETAK